jgi:hypothetical protein
MEKLLIGTSISQSILALLTSSLTTSTKDSLFYLDLKPKDWKELDFKQNTGHNKNYMSIAVSVLTTSRVARNSGGEARQENRPQSATAYSSVR